MKQNNTYIHKILAAALFGLLVLCSCEQAAQPPARRAPTEAEQYFMDKIRSATSETTIKLDDKKNQISDFGYIYEAMSENTGIMFNLDLNGVSGSVRALEAYEFAGLTNLKSITITHGIGSIGANAFDGCTGLEKVEVYTGRGGNFAIGDYAFKGCEKFTGLSAKDPNNGGNTGTFTITSVGKGAYYGCKALQTSNAYIFPLNINNISANEFAATSFSSVTIPSHIETINSGAFSNTNLTSVTLTQPTNTLTQPTNLKYLSGFDNLTSSSFSITLPDSVNTIGTGAFTNTKIGSLDFNKVTEIETGAFSSSSISSATLTNVETVGNSAFSDCKSLNSVTLGTNTKTIGDSAFENCTALAGINFSSAANFKTISSNTFKGCTSLKTVNLGSNITSIGESAFENCGTDGTNSLTTITIPASVTSIGVNAFKGCTNLATINVPDSTPASLGRGAFDGLPSGFKIKVSTSGSVPATNLNAYKTKWAAYASHIE